MHAYAEAVEKLLSAVHFHTTTSGKLSKITCTVRSAAPVMSCTHVFNPHPFRFCKKDCNQMGLNTNNKRRNLTKKSCLHTCECCNLLNSHFVSAFCEACILQRKKKTAKQSTMLRCYDQHTIR